MTLKINPAYGECLISKLQINRFFKETGTTTDETIIHGDKK